MPAVHAHPPPAESLMPSTPPASKTHLVLIPSYNTGRKLEDNLRTALEHWAPVWVVIDGSSDGSDTTLDEFTKADPRLKVLRLPKNQGKGAAVLHGARAALAEGFTHAVCIDADGQHPEPYLPRYVEQSHRDPGAMILGTPIFDESAPRIRVNGRKAANFWVRVETLWDDIGDSMFGMRAYPLKDLVAVMDETRWARRYDFDTEVAIRLSWRGVYPVNLPTPVRYLTEEEGGISHYRYGRDNIILTGMFFRLFAQFWTRIPSILRNRRARQKAGIVTGEKSRIRKITSFYEDPGQRSYVKHKLRWDPLYDAVFKELESIDPHPVLDVGCGLGLLAFYLRERAIDLPILGVETDQRKVDIALRLMDGRYENLDFRTVDARQGLPKHLGTVTLLDVLQYFTDEGKESLLREAAQRVAPGGALIIRNGLEDSSRRARISRLTDEFAGYVAWIESSVVGYPTEGFIRSILESEGLEGEARPLWGKTPFNNYLLVYRRPGRKTKASSSGKAQE